MDRSSIPHKVLFGTANWALLVAGLANLAIGTYSAFNETAAIAATSLTAGLVLLFAATIDRFESVKGLGVEAKTRQLDQKIHQADEALKRLRETTEMTCAVLMDLNSRTGRLMGPPRPRDSFALADKTRQLMSSLGSDDATIAAALQPWARIICIDMARLLLTEIEQLLSEQIRKVEAERSKIPQPLSPDNAEFKRLSVQIEEISSFLSNRVRKIHLIKSNEFADRFMSLFQEVPALDKSTIEPLQIRAAKFADGMRSLCKESKPINREAWIAELERRYDD